MHEALDAPSLSLLTWDMPKILLRIAIVLVLGPFVSTAKAKVIIHVDLDATNDGNQKQRRNPCLEGVRADEGFETPTGLFSVSIWTPIISPTNTINRRCHIQSSLTRAWPSTAHIKAVSDPRVAWLRPLGGSACANALFLGQTIWGLDRN